MKKIMVLFYVFTLVLIVTGCRKEAEKFEIAMITDVGTIDDESFNQGSWEGIKAYAEKNNISHKYYRPEGESTTEYLDAIELAVENGAKIIVTPGYLFEEAIYIAQNEYPDVTFVLIDGEPHNADYSHYETKENVYPILFAEHESGFLAGYAAVKEGFTNLGFMGGQEVPAVVRFGFGFLQGANYAAIEDNKTVNIRYTYLNTFIENPNIQTQARSWYDTGTDCIFVAAGGAGGSVMNAADALENKYVIGVDVDQSSKSPKVITSAMKELSLAVQLVLDAIYKEERELFIPGKTTILDITNNGVGLPDNFNRFKKFTKEQYEQIFSALKNDTNKIRTNIISDITLSINDLNLERVNVELIE